MSQRIKTDARSDREILVRRDRQRAQPRMTRASRGNMTFQLPPDADRSGNWRNWWTFGGAGAWPDGSPIAAEGNDYYRERQLRGAHRRSKVLGRRKERRQLNRAVMREVHEET
jgi:hypothetical protein